MRVLILLLSVGASACQSKPCSYDLLIGGRRYVEDATCRVSNRVAGERLSVTLYARDDRADRNYYLEIVAQTGDQEAASAIASQHWNGSVVLTWPDDRWRLTIYVGRWPDVLYGTIEE